jgi:hypothetical protein
MNWPWVPEGTFSKGAVGGFVVGIAFFVLVCLSRAVTRIWIFGPWNYLKSAFRIERDSLGMFLVLLVLLLVTILFFRGVNP